MKKSDITIGAEYAYSNYDHGARQRVRVIGEAKVQQGWGYRAKMITGSKILFLDADGQPKKRPDASGAEWTAEVANREIREPWLQYAEREAALAKARRESRNALTKAQDERAKLLLDLIPALRHVGVADSETGIWGSERDVLSALEQHVPETLTSRGEGVLSKRIFTAPYAESLAAYVKSGAAIKVPATALLDMASRH